MKKSLLYSFVLLLLFASCKKDDKSLFNQSADERLNETLSKYQKQLSGSPYGWKGTVYPTGGGTYSFYFKFNDSNRVSMLSDFDSTTAVTYRESSFRLKALQQPSLIFDTYSYIHMLADPNESAYTPVNTGNIGQGLVSDYEFYFDESTADTIKLIGRYNGSKAVLTRATSQEATAFNSGQLAAGLLINKILTYFKRLTIGTQAFDINVSTAYRTITFSYLDAGGNVRTYVANFYFTLGGIVFTNPLVVGNITVSGFSNMQFNSTTEVITTTVNSVAATLTPIVVPIKVDVGAPKRWWDYAAASSDYWISAKGFHVNGVDDAYGITTLKSGSSSYYYLIYWPAYAPGAAGNDFFGPIFLNAAQTSLELLYGTAPNKPTFTVDGRAIFVQRGNYGTHPTTGAAALTRTKLYNAAGYYFVQTSAATYDMVSAQDGKSWISWEF